MVTAWERVGSLRDRGNDDAVTGHQCAFIESREMRIRWLTSATKTVSTYGSDESVTEIGGSVGYKEVGRGFFKHRTAPVTRSGPR